MRRTISLASRSPNGAGYYNMEVFIVSGDKDFGQLIGDHVWLYDTMKNVRYDAQGVFRKNMGECAQINSSIIFLSSAMLPTTFPGSKVSGKKGAIKLLEQFENS